MRRRDFIIATGAMLSPFAVAAQGRNAVIGVLRSTTRADSANLLAALREGLRQADAAGVAIEERYAENQQARLTGLAADLIQRPVTVLAGDNISIIAARRVSTTVPMVFVSGGDPVRIGLVGSLNRPGGNITGVTYFSGLLGTKRLQLIREITPRRGPIALLLYPGTPTADAEREDVEAAARALDQPLLIFNVKTDDDLERAFPAMAGQKAIAVLVGGSAFLNSHRPRLLDLTAQYGLPAMYFQREFVRAGGLMSYGSSVTEAWRAAGEYAGRILKGEKPADLPVVRSTTFEFAINLKTAKSLGLAVPPSLLALADEVVE